jgi:hypothetical protein
MTRAPAIDIVTAMNSPALFQRWFPGESWDGWRAVLIADFTDANRALAAKAAKISGAAEMRPSRGPLASDVNASGPRFAVMGMTKMGAEKKRVGRPPNPVAPAKPTLWEKPAVAQQLDPVDRDSADYAWPRSVQ